jgi:hypothetical protein
VSALSHLLHGQHHAGELAAVLRPKVVGHRQTNQWHCDHRRLQDELDQRSAELIALRKAAVEEQAAAPGLLSAPLQSALGRWGAGPQVCYGQGPAMEPKPRVSPNEHEMCRSAGGR